MHNYYCQLWHRTSDNEQVTMNKIANVGYDSRVGYDGVVYVIEQTTANKFVVYMDDLNIDSGHVNGYQVGLFDTLKDAMNSEAFAQWHKQNR